MMILATKELKYYFHNGFVPIRALQVLNRRLQELLHAVCTTPPSVLSTDGINCKLIYSTLTTAS